MIAAVEHTRGRYAQIPNLSLGWDTLMLAGEEEQIGGSSSAPQSVDFPRGSYDVSLLVKYKHHIARHLWFTEVSK